MLLRSNLKHGFAATAPGLAAVVMLVSTASSASAAVTFSYAADQTSYLANPGENLTVTLLLIEQRDSDGDASVLVAENGLVGFDVRVDRQVGTAAITDAVANTGIFGFAFDMYSPNKPLGSVGTAEFIVGSLDELGPTGVEDGLRRVLELGTVTIQAPLTIGEISTFSILNSAMGNNTVTNAMTALDNLIDAGSFSVQVVPEPAALALLGLPAAILATRRRRPHLRK